MHPLVVNIHHKKPYDVYIGRGRDQMHWGNPFTHMSVSLASVQVASREEAIQCFKDWIEGKAHQDVQPERRKWMLEHLSELKGKTLGCFCSPKGCHGDVLAELAEKS